MKQSNESCLEQQSKGIYEFLIKLEQKNAASLFESPSFRHRLSKHIFRRYGLDLLFALIVFSGAVIAMAKVFELFSVSQAFEFIKWACIFVFLVLYVSIPSVQIMELYADRRDMLKLVRHPNVIVFEGLIKSLKADCALRNALHSISIEALELVRARIDVQRAGIELRMGALIGALPKIGVVPGLITLIFAANSNLNDFLALVVAAVVILLYVFAYSIHYSMPRLDLYIQLIQSEIDGRNDSKG